MIGKSPAAKLPSPPGLGLLLFTLTLALSRQGRGKPINPLPWRERIKVRGILSFVLINWWLGFE